ncbi:MAG: tetratricopeptide repeat protein [Pirellulaceae bacterium]|nr:tetratricopeptide repeat protein [Pirellulaceae bacterium]
MLLFVLPAESIRRNLARLTCAAGLALGLWTSGSSPSTAQEPGQFIVVVGEASLKVRDEVVGTLYPGTILKVTRVNGKWLALEGQRGWFDKNSVRDIEAAIPLYQERTTSNPSDLEAWSILGSLYYHEDVFPASIEAYNQALRLDSKRPQLFNNRGLTLSAQGRFELAEKDFQTAIRLAPKYAQAYANLGWLYFTSDKLAEAIQQYNKAVELEKDNPSHYINRAGCFREQNRLDDAMRDFVKAVELSGNVPDGYVGQSTILMDKLDFAGAIAAAEKALELDKLNVQAMINRGWAKHLQGNADAALTDLSQAVALEPGSLLALLNRSAVLLELKRYDEAESDLKQAEALDAEHPGVWLNWGELFWQQRRFAEALVAYKKSVELGPELAEGQNGLAWFYATCPEADKRQAAEAVKLAMAANKSTQNKDWSHVDTLAAAYANGEQYADAIRFAEAALQLAPANKKPDVEQRLTLYRQNQPYRW